MVGEADHAPAAWVACRIPLLDAPCEPKQRSSGTMCPAGPWREEERDIAVTVSVHDEDIIRAMQARKR